MILYTPLANTDIFPAADDAFTKRQCVAYQGKQFYVEETEDGAYQVLQLLSTDPQDFMKQEYNPGTILK
ncbi:YlzJ-like family protein [Virgibacillus siamensis]|uniref:YlzJ-like family protein n=1 Tax=Virgibacillus siamensis TaxID=480071 RepID=UPI00158B9EA5|nr:YlzJ-like family protein [Virgibacillus siamensis]